MGCHSFRKHALFGVREADDETARNPLMFGLLAGGMALLVHFLRASSPDIRGKMSVDGREQTYLLHIPPSNNNALSAAYLRFMEGWALAVERNDSRTLTR